MIFRWLPELADLTVVDSTFEGPADKAMAPVQWLRVWAARPFRSLWCPLPIAADQRGPTLGRYAQRRRSCSPISGPRTYRIFAVVESYQHAVDVAPDFRFCALWEGAAVLRQLGLKNIAPRSGHETVKVIT